MTAFVLQDYQLHDFFYHLNTNTTKTLCTIQANLHTKLLNLSSKPSTVTQMNKTLYTMLFGSQKEPSTNHGEALQGIILCLLGLLIPHRPVTL